MQVTIKERPLLPVIIAFFVFFYLYILLRIDLRIVYHGAGYVPFPYFFKGIDFFVEYLNSPGRIIEYITAFLAQLYYFYYLGPLVVTLVVILIYLLTENLITVMGGIRNNVFVFIPLILILIMYNNYYNYLLQILSVFVSLLFFWFYTLSNKYKAVFRVVLFPAFFTILFYTSINSLFLFIVLCSLFEIFIKRKWLIGSLYIIFSAIVLHITSVYILDLTAAATFKQIIPYPSRYYLSENTAVYWIFYFFFPLSALWFGLWQLLKKLRKLQKYDKMFIRYGRKRIRHILAFLTLFIITVISVFFLFNETENINLKINYFSRNEMWHKVIEEVDRMPLKEYNVLINHEINKALYYEGRLLYEMFSYPQVFQSLLTLGPFILNTKILALSEFILISDTCFRLGLLNYAEHAAHEALETLGERPIILKQLIIINIIQRDFNVAEMFLNKLSKDLIYGKKAGQYKKLLAGDDPALLDEIIRCKPASIIDKEYDMNTSFDLLFKGLVDNKVNHMGFEYLMAYYLLSFQFDKITNNFHLLDDYNYPDIPRNIEEALVIYSHMTGSEVDLHGRTLSAESIQRYKDFSDAIHHFRNNQSEGLRYISNNFGKTYYFHHFLYLLNQGAK